MIEETRKNGSTPSPKEQAAVVLLQGGSVDQAAIASGRSKSAVYYWLREDPDFREMIQNASRERVVVAGRKMSSLLVQVLEDLQEQMDSGVLDLDQKLRLFDMLAKHLNNFWLYSDIEDRLSALEHLAD